MQGKRRPSWEPVAEALRSGDDRQAERRLLRLAAERGAEGAAAELALAQLRLRTGDVEGARPILERLARGNDDALVARRARRALTSLNSLRSTAHEGTHGEPKQ